MELPQMIACVAILLLVTATALWGIDRHQRRKMLAEAEAAVQGLFEP